MLAYSPYCFYLIVREAQFYLSGGGADCELLAGGRFQAEGWKLTRCLDGGRECDCEERGRILPGMSRDEIGRG